MVGVLRARVDEVSRARGSTRSCRAYTQLEVALRKAQGEAQRLRAESASKHLEISTLARRKGELKEDREMLNIALDSKQQEVELVSVLQQYRAVLGMSAGQKGDEGDERDDGDGGRQSWASGTGEGPPADSSQLKRKLARAAAHTTPSASALGSSMATTTGMPASTPLPLGTSTRANRVQLHPDTVARTPGPGAGAGAARKYGSVRSHATPAPAPQTVTKRRSSATAAAGTEMRERERERDRENLAPQMQTPLVQNGKSARHGAQLYASTQVQDRVMRRQAVATAAV
jgi:hypothetical protein